MDDRTLLRQWDEVFSSECNKFLRRNPQRPTEAGGPDGPNPEWWTKDEGPEKSKLAQSLSNLENTVLGLWENRSHPLYGKLYRTEILKGTLNQEQRDDFILDFLDLKKEADAAVRKQFQEEHAGQGEAGESETRGKSEEVPLQEDLGVPAGEEQNSKKEQVAAALGSSHDPRRQTSHQNNVFGKNIMIWCARKSLF